MSAEGSTSNKKAVHVKWAGKTIALGTFPAAEADEKCARAKALTRAWRSTMRPKPSREWVMLELERLHVRVVSGRLGRKGGEDDGDDNKVESKKVVPDRDGSMGVGGGADFGESARRSSFGMNLLSDDVKRRNGSLGLGFDGGDPSMPPHRPLVGGGSAAAYEAARADHYSKPDDPQRRTPGGVPGGPMGLSVNPNQHYEMLKLHHMNLLNEIQETTLMMNLYQQQQLQQQQHQLQQQQGTIPASGPMSMLQGAAGGLGGQRLPGAVGGFGSGTGSGPSPTDIPSAGRVQHQETDGSINKEKGESTAGGDSNDEEEDDEAALEAKLKAMKDDIARRQKEAEELEAATKVSKGKDGREKRKTASKEAEKSKKKAKSGDDSSSS